VGSRDARWISSVHWDDERLDDRGDDIDEL
jgi:hypothetical protein